MRRTNKKEDVTTQQTITNWLTPEKDKKKNDNNRRSKQN